MTRYRIIAEARPAGSLGRFERTQIVAPLKACQPDLATAALRDEGLEVGRFIAMVDVDMPSTAGRFPLRVVR